MINIVSIDIIDWLMFQIKLIFLFCLFRSTSTSTSMDITDQHQRLWILL
ncbi:unnamed protein product, partial [Rotaria sp. Silwood1]